MIFKFRHKNKSERPIGKQGTGMTSLLRCLSPEQLEEVMKLSEMISVSGRDEKCVK